MYYRRKYMCQMSWSDFVHTIIKIEIARFSRCLTLCDFLSSSVNQSLCGENALYWDTPYAHPYFDNTTKRDITATVGQPALLHCRVRNLGDRAVSIYVYIIIIMISCNLAECSYTCNYFSIAQSEISDSVCQYLAREKAKIRAMYIIYQQKLESEISMTNYKNYYY